MLDVIPVYWSNAQCPWAVVFLSETNFARERKEY